MNMVNCCNLKKTTLDCNELVLKPNSVLNLLESEPIAINNDNNKNSYMVTSNTTDTADNSLNSRKSITRYRILLFYN